MASKKRSPKPAKPRTERRRAERKLRDVVQLRTKLADLEDGGTPERPIAAATPSVIESKTATKACPLCGGGVVITGHDVVQREGHSLRAVRAKCKLCHVERTTYFEIRAERAH